MARPKTPLVERFSEKGLSLEDELINLINKHQNASTVANEIYSQHGIKTTKQTVGTYLSNLGIGCRYIKASDDDIYNMYVQCHNEQDVADYFNISKSYVHDALLRQLEKQQ